MTREECLVLVQLRFPMMDSSHFRNCVSICLSKHKEGGDSWFTDPSLRPTAEWMDLYQLLTSVPDWKEWAEGLMKEP